MKVKIIAETFVRGEVVKAGKVIEVDDATGRILIENYKAERVVERPEKNAEKGADEKKNEGKKEE